MLGRNQTQKPISKEYAKIGANLKKLRTSHNMTQEELSNELGVSTVTIANYETGTRKLPLSLLIKIAAYFDVSVDSMMGISAANKDHEHIVLSDNPRMINAQQRWFDEVGVINFTDEEIDELIKFAQYLVWKRNDK